MRKTKVVIEAEPKEIADLVVAVQSRQFKVVVKQEVEASRLDLVKKLREYFAKH